VSTYFKWTLHAAETSTRKGAGKIALTLNEPSHLADNAFQDVAHHAVCRFACGASLINLPKAIGVRKARS
ncbi:hypothetical protein ACCS88_36025, partial [Rhizobium ruizarguesonis]